MYEFLTMGGYAIYVWSAYAVTVLILIFNLVSPRLQQKKSLKKAQDYYFLQQVTAHDA